MSISEYLYNIKKKIVYTYKAYFTEEGTYTSLLSDKAYLKRLYKKRMGKELNLKNPETFTEKLNWLKLYDRRPEYTMMADKYAVRDYVKEKIGEEYLVPLIGVWDRIEDIDFDSLPDKFVLKCNHDNGVIICKDKSKFDVEKAKKDLAFHLGRDYYKKCREWPYKDIKRKIICEQFMENENDEELFDYKLFCFNGIPKFVMLNSCRFVELKTDMYDMDWNHLEMQDGHYPKAGDIFEKPDCLDTMVEMAKMLSNGIPFVRVDFNYWNEKIYFGELTFYHSAAVESFQPADWDKTVGDMLILPEKKRG